jgi:hypothetical protein
VNVWSLSLTRNILRKKRPSETNTPFTAVCPARAVHTTDPICADCEEAALALAKRESRDYFNRCRQCGTWIGDSAYNIDEAKCVLCAPVVSR